MPHDTSPKEKGVDMNEKAAEQLVKQLKILNFWITTFGVLFLVTLAIIAYMLFQVFMFVKKTNDTVTNLKNDTAQRLDVKSNACSGQGSVSDWLQKNGWCN